jgi:hypothetical protein
MAWSDSESDTWVIMGAHSLTAHGTRTGFKTMADVAMPFFGNAEEQDVDHPPAGQAETVKRRRTGYCDPAFAMDALRRVVEGQEPWQSACMRHKISKDMAFDVLSALLRGNVEQRCGRRSQGSGIPDGLIEQLTCPPKAGSERQFATLLVGALDGQSCPLVAQRSKVNKDCAIDSLIHVLRQMQPTEGAVRGGRRRVHPALGQRGSFPRLASSAAQGARDRLHQHNSVLHHHRSRMGNSQGSGPGQTDK